MKNGDEHTSAKECDATDASLEIYCRVPKENSEGIAGGFIAHFFDTLKPGQSSVMVTYLTFIFTKKSF